MVVIVDISACVIVDGLINPTVLAWLMIGCWYKYRRFVDSLINPTECWLDCA